MNILEINNLSAEYYRNKTVVHALNGVSLDVIEGETLSIVGESGCGKSTLAMSVLGLILPPQGRITTGEIMYDGRDLLKSSKNQWRGLRGKDISIVFQDPFSSLNPVLTVYEQLTETAAAHNPGLSKEQLAALADASLKETVFTDTGRILASYPHQLSGGQRQRIMLAMAIINRPKILIADEPTTSLDVTIQKEVMDVIEKLQKELSLTVILITHNLLLAKQRSGRIAVMYAGEIVELNSKDGIFNPNFATAKFAFRPPMAGLTPPAAAHSADFSIEKSGFNSPCHPYTRALMESVPKLLSKTPPRALSGQPPELSAVAPGCSFAPRCPKVMERCRFSKPADYICGKANVRCFLYAK